VHGRLQLGKEYSPIAYNVTNDSGAESPERWLHDYNYHRPHLAHAGRPPIAALNNVSSTPSPYGLPLSESIWAVRRIVSTRRYT